MADLDAFHADDPIKAIEDLTAERDLWRQRAELAERLAPVQRRLYDAARWAIELRASEKPYDHVTRLGWALDYLRVAIDGYDQVVNLLENEVVGVTEHERAADDTGTADDTGAGGADRETRS